MSKLYTVQRFLKTGLLRNSQRTLCMFKREQLAVAEGTQNTHVPKQLFTRRLGVSYLGCAFPNGDLLLKAIDRLVPHLKSQHLFLQTTAWRIVCSSLQTNLIPFKPCAFTRPYNTLCSGRDCPGNRKTCFQEKLYCV